ncbi:Inositol 2-dehydrogenase/D-chiro-inositol 3-dehydrogenase [subsurface metagenome]
MPPVNCAECDNKITRRRFFKKVSIGAAGVIGFPHIVPSSVLGANGAVPPSEKIVMGFIGAGSMGSGHLRTFLGYKDVRVAAVCDLREMFRQKAKDRVNQHYGGKGCETYHDFREMLGRKDIDAVTVVTPDHWHSLIGLEAARNGKDMYYEKPLSMSVTEDKVLRDTINRYGVIFQFGTQQRSDNRFRFACELVRNERIGKLHTIMVGSHPSITCPNQLTQPMPDRKEFDYDMWLGPAQWAPYTYQRCASRVMGTLGMWTYIYDYSLGGLSGAWGIHHIDIAQWGNGTDNTGPIEIEGTGVFPEDGLTDTAIAWEIEHKYANGVKMIHMNSKTALKRASQFSLHSGVGILFLGSEGWVFVCRNLIEAHPKSLLTSIIGPDEIGLYRSNNHRRNFLDCVKTRQKTICPIETAVRSDTICHQDDIAIRLGHKLRWDPEREKFINDGQANRMLTRPMRSPWHL